jgi:Methylamine utilisation protein MauE
VYSIDPVVGAIICGSCALLFAVAGAHKLRRRPEFAATLAGYQVLPARLVSPASLLVPILECLIAAGLLIPSACEWAAFAGAALLAVYAAAMGLNLLRGRRQLDCGCLGPRGGGVISGALVWRNILVALALAGAGGTRWSGWHEYWLDVGTVLAAVFVMGLLYSAVNGLLAVATRHLPQRG